MPPASELTETATVVTTPAKGRGGRPRKQGKAELADRICKEIQGGVPKTKAFVFCGISEDTGSRWEKDDEQFAAAIVTAEARYTEKLRKQVEKGKNVAGLHDWRASAFLLERRDRKHYAKPDKEAAGGTNITLNNTVNLTVISAKELADFQAREKLALEGLLHGRN